MKLTNKQINDYNKLIAEYEGWETIVRGKSLLIGNKECGYWGVLYDKDWSALMNIVDKIEAEEGYRFYLESNEEHSKAGFTTMGIPGKHVVSVKHFGYKRITVWLACIEFIKSINYINTKR